jgi:hypothetical protein
MDQGRVLYLSPFKDQQRRATAQMAAYRNLFVAALADAVFVAHAHADPEGNTERLVKETLAWGNQVYTFDDPSNAHLLAVGARPVPLESKAAVCQLLQTS